MSDERYNGWANRETWAVALHINNDQGWQESVLDALREANERVECVCPRSETLTVHESYCPVPAGVVSAGEAGEIIRENVVYTLEPMEETSDTVTFSRGQWLALQDIGDLTRVDWTELGKSFLEDLEES